MSKARGRVQSFEAAQVGGIDTRVWQDKGTSSDNRGVYFTLAGEVASVAGIKPLVRLWRDNKESLENPFDGREITSLGVFSRDGVTDLLIEHRGRIGILRGDKIEDLVTDRYIPLGLSESTRFIQVANNLLILNGKDPNLKWDGEKITPLGIVGTPNAPSISEEVTGDGKVSAIEASARFWSGYSIKGTSTEREYRYKVSWISEFGQESELSKPSNNVSDAGISVGDRYLLLVTGLEGTPPQDDIIGRNIYRTVDGFTYYLIKYLPGTDGDDFIDHTSPIAPLTDVEAEAGTNNPPPLSTFAFYYRGRTYYGGNPELSTALFFSGVDGAKEAVKPSDVVIIGNNVADPLTGFALAGDFALIFKERSTYMLTQDKEGKPIITPISTSVGAVSDKAAVGFEGKVFFVSESGLYAFDGSKIVPISPDIAEVVKKVPRATLKNSFGWAEPMNRRVFFSIATGPGSQNNEVWALHVDNGGLSRIDATVTSVVGYKGQTVVGYAKSEVTDLGAWGAGTKIYYRLPTSGDLSSDEITRSFETRWIFGNSPQTDKTFYRLDVFYVQTGGYQVGDPALPTESFDNRIYVEWYTDWDRNVVGGTTLTPADPSALLWDEANSDGSGALNWAQVSAVSGGWAGYRKLWDEKRVRCQKISLGVSERVNPASPVPLITPTTDPSGENITAKSLKIAFSGGGDAGWRVVGFLLHMENHGVRGDGTDHG